MGCSYNCSDVPVPVVFVLSLYVVLSVSFLQKSCNWLIFTLTLGCIFQASLHAWQFLIGYQKL